jgi:hypothetical protein
MQRYIIIFMFMFILQDHIQGALKKIPKTPSDEILTTLQASAARAGAFRIERTPSPEQFYTPIQSEHPERIEMSKPKTPPRNSSWVEVNGEELRQAYNHNQ